ncbi:hypothetical protein EYF80_059175 [Liparis tanakae]|uniref:Uncharacterized protein n=1 Tax=Liparis tanakae TaxID=230148 RepID=A0A4Z2EQW8_9TELE|nr:hypothetical protein EYF80_059175 [Liparis tanakae]
MSRRSLPGPTWRGGGDLPPALLGSSAASDASLLSSLLDSSSVQETTLVDTFWESTGVEDQSALDSDVLKHRSVSPYRPSSPSSSSSSSSSSSEPGTSTLYCRDRSLKSKTGVLWLRWALCALTRAWQVCAALLPPEENPAAGTASHGLLHENPKQDPENQRGSVRSTRATYRSLGTSSGTSRVLKESKNLLRDQ